MFCTLYSCFNYLTTNNPISVENFTTGDEHRLTAGQYFVNKVLKSVLIKSPKVLIIHYMGENLFSWLPNQSLNECLTFMVNNLRRATFKHNSRENATTVTL